MTTANKITIVRIMLIPVFVIFAIYYGDSVRDGAPDERCRWAAVLTFVVAAASDGLDGFVARRFGQHSRLGRILDPVADKGLLMAALITLSVTGWDPPFPLWFPVVYIARDLFTIGGAFVVNHLAGEVDIRPHWTGKVATCLTMVAIGWAMFDVPWLPLTVPAVMAAFFVVVSGIYYTADGMRQIHDAGHGRPEGGA